MTNGLIILFYTPLWIMTAMLLAVAAVTPNKTYFVRHCVQFYACILGLQTCEILSHMVGSAALIRVFFSLKLAFVSLLSAEIFLTVAGFLRMQRLFPKWLRIALYFVPALSVVLAVTSPLHSLLLSGFEVIAREPLLLVRSVGSVWFQISMLYSLGASVAIFIILLLSYRTMPHTYRSAAMFMLLGVVVYFVFSGFERLKLDAGFGFAALDFSLIGISLSGIMLYMATLISDRLDYMHIGKRDLFHHLDEGVLILSPDGVVIDANRSAQLVLSSLGCEYIGKQYDDMLRGLIREGKIKREMLPEDGAEYIYVLSADVPRIYRQKLQLFVSDNKRAGLFVIQREVTNERMLMERYRETAGVDTLTGLANRYRCQQLLREYDSKSDLLPLSIVVADMNGLKNINDTQGHRQGDIILKRVADALRDSCPEGCVAARIGGDEFMLLLPRYSEQEARKVIGRLKEIYAAQNEGALIPLSLGVATKVSRAENINQLVSKADWRMYDDKKSVGQPGARKRTQ